MNDKAIKLKTQEYLNKNQPLEALQFIFDNYLQEHPNAKDIPTYRDKIVYKLKTEFLEDGLADNDKSKILLYGFTSVIGHSEGETAFNLILLLLHLLRKGHKNTISEAIELIKLEKASSILSQNGKK